MMPIPTLKMAKASFFNLKEVEKAVDGSKIKVLNHAGGRIRTIARNSMKPAKKFKRKRRGSQPGEPRQLDGIYHSQPGEAPRWITGALRDGIFYGYDKTSESVVVGPLRLNQKRSGAHRTLELGGDTTIQVLERRGARNYKRAGTLKESRFFVDKRIRIAPRPYMLPALETAKPKIPQEFHNMLGVRF